MRHPDRIDALREVGTPERAGFLERALEEIQQARSELELNPTVEVAAEALLVRIETARTGRPGRLVGHGRMPF